MLVMRESVILTDATSKVAKILEDLAKKAGDSVRTEIVNITVGYTIVITYARSKD